MLVVTNEYYNLPSTNTIVISVGLVLVEKKNVDETI